MCAPIANLFRSCFPAPEEAYLPLHENVETPPPPTARVPYSSESWRELETRVTLTPSDIQTFLDYRHDSSDYIADSLYATDIKFFYGNCDDSKEGSSAIGLESGLRTIQTCLSAFSKFYTFQSLTLDYNLSAFHSNVELTSLEYGQKVFRDNGIPFQLYTYGKVEPSNDQYVKLGSFHAEHGAPRTLGLYDTLLRHFTYFKTPLMVCSGTQTFCILGIKTVNSGDPRNKIILWVADPNYHSRQEGLYFLVFDRDSGALLHNTNSKSSIDPNKTAWTLLCPLKSDVVGIFETKAKHLIEKHNKPDASFHQPNHGKVCPGKYQSLVAQDGYNLCGKIYNCDHFFDYLIEQKYIKDYKIDNCYFYFLF
jgi:hypothetical protein